MRACVGVHVGEHRHLVLAVALDGLQLRARHAQLTLQRRDLWESVVSETE